MTKARNLSLLVAAVLLIACVVWGTDCVHTEVEVCAPPEDSLAICPEVKTEGLYFDDLVTFLEADKTNEIPYIRQNEAFVSPGDFVCHDFAMAICRNAEMAGITAGFVSVRFEGRGNFHALNAFDTIDRGIVFVDCSKGYDAFVQLEIGKPYVASYSGITSEGVYAVATAGFIVLDYRIAWDYKQWGDMWRN